MSGMFCLDVEASALEGGYPVEIGIAEVASGAVRAWLIRPAAAWIEQRVWNAEAEAVHGLSLTQITAEGLPPEEVADELARAIQGARVLSDNPSYDGAWLDTLYRATGATSAPMQLEDFHAYAWRFAAQRRTRPDIAIVKAKAEAWHAFPKEHRAGPDAQRNAEMLRQIGL